MYSGMIQGNCASETPLTGIGNCPKQEGKVVALLITDRKAMYPIEKDAFISALEQNVTVVGQMRILPIKSVVSTTINGGDINAPEVGNYGGPSPIGLNAKNVAYQIDAGDCLYKELSKLNQRKMRVFRVDDKGFVYGTVVEQGGEQFFAGFEATLYTSRVATDGSTAYNLSITAYYTANNEQEEINMNAFEVGLNKIPDGLIGVRLKKGTGTGTATVVTVCGGEDVTADYGDKWAAELFLNESGEAPTSATFNAGTGLITFDPVASYRVASASVLAGADIDGLEGVDELVSLT